MKKPVNGSHARYRHTCPFCMRQFSSSAALSMHRIGSYIQRTVRCLDDDEMDAHGLTLHSNGVWDIKELSRS